MKYQAPALSRGLKILEILSYHKEPLTINQVAKKLDVNTNQIFRLMYVLVNDGYLDKNESDTFTISSKLFSLGMEFIKNYSLLDILIPILKEVSLKTRQSCHCSIKLNEKMVVIAKADSPNNFVFSIRVGYSQDLETTTSGKVILTHLPESEQSDFLKTIKDKYLKSEYESIVAQIMKIKKQGYLIAPSPFVEGIHDIAVPVIAEMSHVGTFSIVIPYVNSSNNIATKEASLKVLKEAAKRISALLI